MTKLECPNHERNERHENDGREKETPGQDGTTDNAQRNGKTERTTNEPNDSNGSFDQSVRYSSHSTYSWFCSWLRPKAALGPSFLSWFPPVGSFKVKQADNHPLRSYVW